MCSVSWLLLMSRAGDSGIINSDTAVTHCGIGDAMGKWGTSWGQLGCVGRDRYVGSEWGSLGADSIASGMVVV